MGQFQQAIEMYRKAIELNPEIDEAHNNLGICYGETGNFIESIKMFEKAVELNPKYTEAYNNLGSSYYYLEKNYPKAIEMFKKAINLDSNYVDPYENLAVVYLSKGDTLTAVEFFKKSAKLGRKTAKQWLQSKGYGE